MSKAVQWRGEGVQHQGARPYQEDSWALKPLADGALLAVVSDGMGGHAGGAVASRLVVEAFVAAIAGGRSMADALQASNQAVKAGASAKPDLAGMGATLVAATLQGEEVRWISVGDSPLYLVASGELQRLNADHSMAPQIDQLVARGVLSAEEAAHHPGRHTLREAVMGGALALIDQGSRGLEQGDCLLLCSDGVQSLGDREIASSAGKSAQAVIDTVLAARRPHQDNVTVIKLERRA